MTSTKETFVNVLYDDDDVLLKGAQQIREKGYDIQEVYSPFPIHGLDHALGYKESRIGIAAFFYGILGLIVASSLTYGMMIVDWPMNIGGKPSFTWGENMPAFVPIMFELTVFFAAHLMVWTFFFRSGLYPGKKVANPDPRTTDDQFLMEVNPKDGEDHQELLEMLRETGATEVRLNNDTSDA